MISVKVEMPELAELLKDESRDIMRIITFGTADGMKAKIAEPKSGRKYKRGSRFHTASAAGEAPANDSSNLLTSITPTINDLRGEIVLAEYGLFLEFGTTKMTARPFIIPSLEEILDDL